MMFHRLVFVATGSGIGPVLAHILAKKMTIKLVWITRDPVRTYGRALVDEVLAAQPDALIWNTDRDGKPDLVNLVYETVLRSSADAVICVSNKKATWQVVHTLELLRVPAIGPSGTPDTWASRVRA
jgi:ferredoxin-NADP reductase